MQRIGASSLKINLVIDVLRKEEKLLVKEMKKRQIKHDIILADKISLDINSTIGTEKDEIYFLRSPSYFKSNIISSYLEAQGCLVSNGSWIFRKFSDKFQTEVFLKKHGFKVIPSSLSFSRHKALECAEKIGYPVIIKPIIGGFGKLVHLAETARELDQIIELYDKFSPAMNKIYYLQKYLYISRDIRILTMGRKIITSVLRESEFFKKNVAQGAVTKNYALSKPEEKIIREFLNLIPDCSLGIDLLVDCQGNQYICDVNPCFLFNDTMKASDINIPHEYVSYLISQVTRKESIS
ncbi:hypothetical protein CN489_17595 [Bacillus cereus]|nr:hypothetical protein CN489_17595 [Bacillus cereus]PFI78832.1 hypothetical protein COI83_26820 [Bacillus cereus]PFO99855.1 hypothetical protein COJ97_15150 [Bacillus cereus]